MSIAKHLNWVGLAHLMTWQFYSQKANSSLPSEEITAFRDIFMTGASGQDKPYAVNIRIKGKIPYLRLINLHNLLAVYSHSSCLFESLKLPLFISISTFMDEFLWYLSSVKKSFLPLSRIKFLLLRLTYHFRNKYVLNKWVV